MAEVTVELVKKLREVTGAGMMDCKQALTERNGDIEGAKDWLREKGLARAAARGGRSTNEGAVEAYVHGGAAGVSKLGVLVEVDCESDFVAKTDDFKTLTKELALQIAGAAPQYVRREDVPVELVEREKSVLKEQIAGKPDNIVEKIIDGKMDAFYSEICLLDQIWIRDEKRKKKVVDLVNEAIAKLGENITVARFARFQVGETSPASSQ